MIKAILTDIEGTTSSISFVKETLFPYARKHLPAFIVTHGDDTGVRHWLHEAAKEADLVSATQDEMIALLQRWIDEDRKSTALKALQGMIWEEGYRNGEFKAHVYADVPPAFKEWTDKGLAVYVYSSGSVPAQKLFFGFSEAGDVTATFSGYFDTEIGAKRDPDSYRRIANDIGVSAGEILFLSDTVEELDAARTAGMRTMLLARPPSTCPNGGPHPCVNDFHAIAVD
ncbi:MAG TPA: acireductone synthase [Rudaea sp.]|jgi:enolase-phosphatase E1|nr:acireductone synthase [Rudaea sp.]